MSEDTEPRRTIRDARGYEMITTKGVMAERMQAIRDLAALGIEPGGCGLDRLEVGELERLALAIRRCLEEGSCTHVSGTIRQPS